MGAVAPILLATLPPPATATAVSRSVHGLGGVLFVDFASGERVVLKALASDVEAGSALFSADCCRAAGIAHPEVALLDVQAGLGAELATVVRRLVSAAGEELAPAAHEQLVRAVENVFQNRNALLMEFLRGGVDALPKDGPELCRQRLEAHASTIGRVMGVDMVLNNWDRIGNAALGSWLPDPTGFFAPADGPGNLDNLMLSAADDDNDGAEAEVIAIDTDLKPGYPQPAASDADFVSDVDKLFCDLRASERDSRTSTIVREAQRCFERKRGVVGLSNSALAALQRGVVEALSLLACREEALVEQLRAALAAIPPSPASPSDPEPTSEALVARTRRVLRLWSESARGEEDASARPGAAAVEPELE